MDFNETFDLENMICPTFCAMQHDIWAVIFGPYLPVPFTQLLVYFITVILHHEDYSQTTWNATNQLHTTQVAVHITWMIPVSCRCLASCFFSSHFWLHRKIWWRSSGDPYKSMATVPSTRSPGAYSAMSCRNEVPSLGSCGRHID